MLGNRQQDRENRYWETYRLCLAVYSVMFLWSTILGICDAGQQYWMRNQKKTHCWVLHVEMGWWVSEEGNFLAVCVVLWPASSYSEKQLIGMLIVQPFFLHITCDQIKPFSAREEAEHRRIHPWSYSELNITGDGFLALTHCIYIQ